MLAGVIAPSRQWPVRILSSKRLTDGLGSAGENARGPRRVTNTDRGSSAARNAKMDGKSKLASFWNWVAFWVVKSLAAGPKDKDVNQPGVSPKAADSDSRALP